MNWGALFFSAEGRIGQKDFWLSAALLFIFGVLAHAAIGVGTLLWVLSGYCWICIYAKRLHDAGRSGWLQIAPWAAGIVLFTLGVSMGLSSVLGLALSGLPHFLGGVVLGGAMSALGLLLLSGLVHLIFLLWLGLTPGQIGSNRYGPEPGAPPFARVA